MSLDITKFKKDAEHLGELFSSLCEEAAKLSKEERRVFSKTAVEKFSKLFDRIIQSMSKNEKEEYETKIGCKLETKLKVICDHIDTYVTTSKETDSPNPTELCKMLIEDANDNFGGIIPIMTFLGWVAEALRKESKISSSRLK